MLMIISVLSIVKSRFFFKMHSWSSSFCLLFYYTNKAIILLFNFQNLNSNAILCGCTAWSRGYKTFFMFSSAETKIYPAHNCSAETQSGLPLLPWSCYASVIQCDIIQYQLFLFYYNTGIISFLAIYYDTILCTIFCVSERLYAKKTLFLTCYDVALSFFRCFVNMFALMFMNEICCIWL